jgi:hypothetical protein
MLALFESKRPATGGDVWRQWDKMCDKESQSQLLKQEILSLWHSLLEKRDAAHLDAALWTAFYVAEGSSEVIRGESSIVTASLRYSSHVLTRY